MDGGSRAAAKFMPPNADGNQMIEKLLSAGSRRDLKRRLQGRDVHRPGVCRELTGPLLAFARRLACVPRRPTR